MEENRFKELFCNIIQTFLQDINYLRDIQIYFKTYLTFSSETVYQCISLLQTNCNLKVHQILNNVNSNCL